MASMSDGAPHSTVCLTSGQSRPIPKAIVAMITLTDPFGSQKFLYDGLLYAGLSALAVHVHNSVLCKVRTFWWLSKSIRKIVSKETVHAGTF